MIAFVQWLRTFSTIKLNPSSHQARLDAVIATVVKFPSLPLLLLGILTFFRDLLAPNDIPAGLFASCLTWTLVFVATSIFDHLQIWRHKLERSSSFRWFEGSEAKVTICFVLAHVCLASSNGAGTSWPYTLLPAAVISIKFLTMDVTPGHPEGMITICATVLSIHCAVVAYQPSITTLTLGICSAIFLSQGFIYCETAESKYEQLELGDVKSPRLMGYVFPHRTTFSLQLRMISFWNSALLIPMFLTVVRSLIALTIQWWKQEIATVILDCGRWVLICFMLLKQQYNSFAVASALAISALCQLFYHNSTRIIPAVESFIAIILLLANSKKVSSIRGHIHSGLIKPVAILFCSILVIATLFTYYPSSTKPIVWENHPIEDLIQTSRARFSETLSKQSQTLAEAARAYRERFGMHPPPKFDIWFAFAKANNVRMIDEYDIIHDVLRPFWGLQPATIRKRARDTMGYEHSHFMGILIRNGDVIQKWIGDWRSIAIAEMMKKFVHHLPDMDLIFNTHDEPSVVIPYDMLAQLIKIAEKNLAISFQHHPPHNYFSGRPSDMVDDIPSVYGSDIVGIEKQTVWQEIIASCPLESPVRNVIGEIDLTTTYAREPLGFIYNTTAFTNVCNQPSLRFHHGFFDRPNAMQYTPVLTPVFSVGKVSSFNDILYPSPWYYDERTPLDENYDMDWELKLNQMHWRGSTTTGYVANGGWRRHHRQRFVKALDGIANPVNILKWIHGQWVQDVMPPAAAQTLFDVKFTFVADTGWDEDRDEQKKEFNVARPESQQSLWKWKHLLDMDGHGISGRFYPMMKSKSLVYKCAMFREWHDEWLRPWVHYVPLGLDGTDWHEAVRYFAQEEAGQREAEKIANESREWARSVLRREDMEAWLFRLLLELSPSY